VLSRDLCKKKVLSDPPRDGVLENTHGGRKGLEVRKKKGVNRLQKNGSNKKKKGGGEGFEKEDIPLGRGGGLCLRGDRGFIFQSIQKK